MMKTLSSRRISSAIASRKASRTLSVTMAVSLGSSGPESFAGWRNSAAGAGGGSVPARAPAFRRLRVRAAEGLHVLALLRDHRNWRIYRDIVGSARHQNLRKRAVVDSLDLHCRLVGFDLGEDIARAHCVTFFFQPLRKPALLHRRRKRGHENVRRHLVSLQWSCPNLSRQLSQNIGPYLSRVRLRLREANSAASAMIARTAASILLRRLRWLARQRARGRSLDHALRAFLHFVFDRYFAGSDIEWPR
jgi:hypothetical protein